MRHEKALLVLGADGCRGGGWAVAVVDGEGELTWGWADGTASLLEQADAHEADAVGLDVPIGLPAVGRTRTCDDLARRRLGPRRSSVFAAPPRDVLECASYAEARPLAPSLSAQAFGLVPRVREVDALLRQRGPRVHERVVECHPEAVFALLAAGRGALPPETSAPGVLLRLRLLEEALDQELPPDAPPGAGIDDALDAAACAVAALRWARGEAEVLGGEPDALGLPMRIVV